MVKSSWPVLHRQGVARASGDGVGWTLVNNGLQARVLLSLALSPGFETDQTMFAAGPDDGVLISRDAGRTWVSQLDGADDPSVFSVAASPNYTNNRRTFAATSAGVYASSDSGAHWRPAPTGLQPSAARAVAVQARPAVGGASPPVLAALANGILLASDDDGESWRAVGEGFGETDIVSVSLSPDHPRDRTIFVGTRNSRVGGQGELVLWRSVDGGAAWTRWLIERGGGLLAVAVPPGYGVGEGVLVGLGHQVLRPLRTLARSAPASSGRSGAASRSADRTS